jgi:mannose-1-phosphate guanylyltransferase
MMLAGGLSTRLYPLTKQIPKPLVPVVGVPNAIHVIRYLESYGYDEIATNVHYLAQSIYDALGDGSRFGVRIEYLHEEKLMGSAGAIKPLEWSSRCMAKSARSRRSPSSTAQRSISTAS